MGDVSSVEAIKSLQEIQRIEFEMMLYLKQLAEKNDIKLMLGGGTLLGAIRHSGFIPWDDDVDLMLMRDDYEKLIECIKKDNNSRYEVFTVYNSASYPHPFAKVIDTRTFIDQKRLLEVRGLGLATDLFPIDAVPRSKFMVEKLFSFVTKKMDEILSLRDLNYHKVSGELEYWMITIRVKMKAFLIDRIARMFSLGNARYVAAIMGRYGKKEIMKKESMMECVKVMFEGEEFLAPIGYKTYLAKHYGKDYMKMPPKSIQRTQHQMNVYWK